MNKDYCTMHNPCLLCRISYVTQSNYWYFSPIGLWSSASNYTNNSVKFMDIASRWYWFCQKWHLAGLFATSSNVGVSQIPWDLHEYIAQLFMISYWKLPRPVRSRDAFFDGFPWTQEGNRFSTQRWVQKFFDSVPVGDWCQNWPRLESVSLLFFIYSSRKSKYQKPVSQ